ncbi:MAG: hypothetical protein JXA69_16625 [Phycisphaerae bacterium]|nr:hypothetical protein [Phycisphaerae bacterium]
MERKSASLSPLMIVVVAMVIGLVAFTAVSLAMGGVRKDPETARVLLLAGVALGVGQIVMYVAVRATTLAKLRRKYAERGSDEDLETFLMPGMMQLTIIGAAMAEGWGLFGVVIHLVTGEKLALAVPAIALVLLVLRIPTRDRQAQFISNVIGRPWP